MMKLVKFECRKVWTNRKNQLVLLLFFSCLLSLFLYFTYASKTYMQEESKKYEREAMELQTKITYNNLVLNQNGTISSLKKNLLMREIEYWQFEYSQYISMKYYLQQNKPEQYDNILIAQNKLYQNRIVLLNTEPTLKDTIVLEMGSLDVIDMGKIVLQNQYILEHHITPEINPYHLTGAKVFVMFFSSWNIMILSILATFVAVDMYLGEMSEGSYKLTYTQPYSRRQVYWAKVMVLIISVGCMFMIAILGIVALATAVNGIGNWSYPMSSRISLFQFTMQSLSALPMLIPLWQYALLGCLMLFSVVGLATMLTWWVSIRIDSNSIAMGAGVLLVSIAFVFSLFVDRSSLVHIFYPFMYMDIDSVLGVENQGNFLIGLSLNLAGILIFHQLSLNCFMKKDLLGAKE